jgi:hypothetical protein
MSSIHSVERYFIENLADRAMCAVIGVTDGNFKSFSTIATLEIICLLYANTPLGSKTRLYVARNAAKWGAQGRPHLGQAAILEDEELVKLMKQFLDV